MTVRAYYDDLYQTSFDAEIISQEEHDGKIAAMLDRTLFYPGGGGQPCDLGTLGGLEVESVYEEDGNIYHVIPGKLPEGTVRGEIDWDRRFELMQQHLGQHILSAVFVRDHSLDTAGLRMDRDSLYIDLSGFVDEEEAAAAEAAANEVIYQNVPVEVLYPTMEEIKRNSKRPIPETSEEIRIVRIGDLDYIPCCGLQNRSTGEVGIVKLLSVGKHKHGSRIHFLCGRPAFRHICEVCSSFAGVQSMLDCSESDVLQRVGKLHEDLDEAKKENKSMLKRIAAAEAGSLISEAPVKSGVAVVSHVLEDTTKKGMKMLYEQLTKEKGVAAVLGGVTPDGAMLVFGCRKGEKRVDVREAFNAALPMIEGKGGGGPSYAQGFGQNTGGLRAAVEKAAEIITNSL
ncbi:MAG: DHHA1 domain-containing protein [Anaerovoracaceae bacterium]|nr:DHHA1 domain-containing protein [Anaerovoracaceae bacterium]